MAEYLGPYFNKYSEVVVPTIISLVSYKSNKEIRNNMVQTAKCMVLNAAPGLSNSLFKLLFPAICD